MKNYYKSFQEADKNFVDTTKLLMELIQDFRLNELVEEISNNSDWLSFISDKSYSHSNGFDKLILFKGSNLKIRLHIYRQANRILNPNIHDHRWDFSSYIIKGSYKSEIFKLSDSGTDKFLYHYYSEASSSDDYKLEFIGNVKLLLIKTNQYDKFDVNSGKAGEIHQIVINDKETTVSLFVTSNYKNDYARVFANNEILQNKTIPSKKLTEEQVIKKLKFII